MKARIITIGDEILIGQIVDTNSAWLAQQFNEVGIDVERIVSIADTRESIHHALEEVPAEVKVVVMTGGLGPTQDDITKAALAEWFESGWRTDDGVLNRVEQHFKDRGITMPEVNKGQAVVPDNCEVLFNHHGSAPGMWFEKNGTVFISMPGVPFEMKAIFSEEAMPHIQQRLNNQTIIHRTIHTQGIGESSLMEIIDEWEAKLRQGGLKLAYLPSVGSVRLRISGFADDGTDIQRQIDQAVGNVLPLISEFAFGFDGAKLQQVIGELLSRYDSTLSIAESCTGGYLSHLITSVPGSSKYFQGSVVSYSNEAKINLLGVEAQTLMDKGSVSEEVAIQMAEGARDRFNTHFAISTTGIAGPDGGTAEKPVGTVWIGITSPSRTYALKFQAGNHRERNIHKSALHALQLLRKEILYTHKLSSSDALDALNMKKKSLRPNG